MAFVPIRIDRTSKPPLGTPLRSDGHWSVQGLVGAWAFNEGAGNSVFDSTGRAGWRPITSYLHPNGLANTSTGQQFYFTAQAYMQAPELTLVWAGTILGDGVTNDNPGLIGISHHDSDSNPYFSAQLGRTAVQSSIYLQWNDNGVYRAGVIPNAIVYGRPTVYVMVVRSGACKVYISGIESYSNNYASTITYGASPRFGVGGSLFVPSQNLNCLTSFAGMFTSPKSPDQIASISANPWQIYEPETVWIEVGGAGEAALFAGSIYGQSSVSAQLSTAITIASQVVAAGSISGGLNTAIRLATSSQGSASTSALLTTAIRMAASAQGYGASIADLSTTIALAADILAASSASGALSTSIRFGGALSGASTTTAALTNAITMAAQAVGLGSISGQLAGTVAAALFSGTISGSSSASANLSTAVILAAAAQGSATAQAALSTALELAAQGNGIGSASGALGTDISGLVGSLHGSSEAQATLATAIHLMGLAAGQCGVVGRLAEPVEILAQLRVMASDPLALTISVRDPLALRVTVH